MIKRTHGQLYKYEEKLHLKQLSEERENKKKTIIQQLEAGMIKVEELKELIESL